MASGRIKWIDEIRGFAIILVVLGHVIGGVDAKLGGGASNILREIIYSFHMPLMFMISGIVSGGGANAISRYWKFLEKGYSVDRNIVHTISFMGLLLLGNEIFHIFWK